MTSIFQLFLITIIFSLYNCADEFNVLSCLNKDLRVIPEIQYYKKMKKPSNSTEVDCMKSILLKLMNKTSSKSDTELQEKQKLIDPTINDLNIVELELKDNPPDEFDEKIVHAIQLGIQETIKKFNKYIDVDISVFFESENKFIDIQLTKDIGFTFQAFAPNNFLNFRLLYRLQDDFKASFKHSKIINYQIRQKSKLKIFHTNDMKFTIQIISKSELDHISSLLSKYFSHFCKFPMSLLQKIVGLYFMKFENYQFYIVVLAYYFPSIYHITTYTDMYSINNSVEPSVDDPNSVKMYSNFAENYKNGLMLPQHIHSNFIHFLKRDIDFLKSLKFINYSLVLVISHFRDNQYTKNRFYKRILNIAQPFDDSRYFPKQEKAIFLMHKGMIFKVKLEIINFFQPPIQIGNNIVTQDPESYASQFILLISRKVFVSNQNINPII